MHEIGWCTTFPFKEINNFIHFQSPKKTWEQNQLGSTWKKKGTYGSHQLQPYSLLMSFWSLLIFIRKIIFCDEIATKGVVFSILLFYYSKSSFTMSHDFFNKWWFVKDPSSGFSRSHLLALTGGTFNVVPCWPVHVTCICKCKCYIWLQCTTCMLSFKCQCKSIGYHCDVVKCNNL